MRLAFRPRSESERGARPATWSSARSQSPSAHVRSTPISPEYVWNLIVLKRAPKQVSRMLGVDSRCIGELGIMKMKGPTMQRRQFLAWLVTAPLGASLVLPSAAATDPFVEVWKDPSCGCCKEWIAHVRNAGFTVTAHDTGNVAARTKAGIARQYGSCHTALVDGYAIEGHVPVREIQRLLKERPAAIGLAVPGMVIGSPGMEQGGRVDPYRVLLLHRDGGSSSFA